MKELKDFSNNDNSMFQKLLQEFASERNYWKLAQAQHVPLDTKQSNMLTEEHYKMIIAEVKRLYAPLQPMVFERDYRELTGPYGMSMDTFASSTFYFSLSCNLVMEYWVRYDFKNCPFEAELVALINRLFAVNKRSKRIRYQSDQLEKYGQPIADEDSQFQYILQ